MSEIFGHPIATRDRCVALLHVAASPVDGWQSCGRCGLRLGPYNPGDVDAPQPVPFTVGRTVGVLYYTEFGDRFLYDTRYRGVSWEERPHPKFGVIEERQCVTAPLLQEQRKET